MTERSKRDRPARNPKVLACTKCSQVFVGELLGRIAIAERSQSEPLLNAVFDHSEKRDFVYEHVWRVGDLLLWDNRCSSHARTDFPTNEHRLMLRTTVEGTVRPY